VRDTGDLIEAFLYDVHKRTLLAKASVDHGDPDIILPKLARALYANVQFGDLPEVIQSEPAIQVRPVRSTIFSKWWFWTGLGVAAAAVSLPFLLSGSNSGPGCPTGQSCGTVILQF